MNLCPSLPGIDLSLPGLEQLKAVEMEVSESVETPTVSGLILLMGQKSGNHQLRLVVFSHYLQGF